MFGGEYGIERGTIRVEVPSRWFNISRLHEASDRLLQSFCDPRLNFEQSLGMTFKCFSLHCFSNFQLGRRGIPNLEPFQKAAKGTE
jgi:hypothetical protein